MSDESRFYDADLAEESEGGRWLSAQDMLNQLQKKEQAPSQQISALSNQVLGWISRCSNTI